MVTLLDSLVSSTARKLPIRVRPDLAARRHRYQGRVYWVVKDPVGLQYYRFQEEEYAILRMLDGETSLDQIKENFEAEFPPQKITLEEIQQYIVTLHRRGLVITGATGQGYQLKKRHDERRFQEFVARWTNVLSLRFRGIDPDRLLTWLDARIGWIFSPGAVAASLLLAASALALIVVQFDVFRAKLPSFDQFFTVQNAVWFAAAMAFTKVLHEFGHGLTCKHFGGECHEMGVLLLVLTPCLYCNVSDSWMLPSKWRRAAIGAAGMYVELIIASICVFLWWFSEPGLFNQLCLSTIFVCSVSTLVFNGNPLLRYDGYYILSDLIEIPNLRQKASEILSRKLGKWCLGIDPPENPFLPQRHQVLFAIYSVAAVVYSWVVVLSILWFLHKVLEPYGLQVFGQLLAAMSLYGLIVMPLWKLYKYFSVPGRLEQVKKTRLAASTAVVAGAVALIVFLPLPYRVFCPLEIEPHEAHRVHVSVPGRLVEVYVKPGEHVEAGAKLAQLSNPELDMQIAQLEGQQRLLQAELEGINMRRYTDADINLSKGALREALASTEKQLDDKHGDVERLLLVAPATGTVLPPPAHSKQTDPSGRLPSWSGTPLEERNLGCYLQQSDLFCIIGNPDDVQANLVIEQSQIDFIAQGQEVDMKLDQAASRTMTGKIAQIAKVDLKVAPTQLSSKAGGEVATKTDASGLERPWTTSYQARVYPLTDAPEGLRGGLRGKAKIHAGWQTLGQRAWRLLGETFNFKL